MINMNFPIRNFYLFPGKLLSRASKVAHMLLTKLVSGVVGKEKVQLCKSGDRVALVSTFK